jgi:hypothetical protein
MSDGTPFARGATYTAIRYAEESFMYRVMAMAATMRAHAAMRSHAAKGLPFATACPSCKSQCVPASVKEEEHPLHHCSNPRCFAPPWSPLSGRDMRLAKLPPLSPYDEHRLRFDDTWLSWFYLVNDQWSAALMLFGVRRYHYREMMEWSAHRLVTMQEQRARHLLCRDTLSSDADAETRLAASYTHLLRARMGTLPALRTDLPDVIIGNTHALLALQLGSDERNECFALERWYQVSTGALSRLPEAAGGGHHRVCTRCDRKPDGRRYGTIEEEGEDEDGDDDDNEQGIGKSPSPSMRGRDGARLFGHRGGHRGKRRPCSSLFGRCASQHHWSTETGYRFPRVARTDPTDVDDESGRYVCDRALAPYHRILFSWAHAHLAHTYYTRLESIYTRYLAGVVRRDEDRRTVLASMLSVAMIWNGIAPDERPTF